MDSLPGEYLADALGAVVGVGIEVGTACPIVLSLDADVATASELSQRPAGAGVPDLPDEAYRIAIGAESVELAAATPAGLFAAAHTLRQLAWLAATWPDAPAVEGAPSADARTAAPPGIVELPSVVSLPGATIVDRPAYPYRGLMLDVARRFYEVADVARVIDQAVLYRINVLHLHLSDDQGWRLAIGAYPELTEVGASVQAGLAGGERRFYTQHDYAAIVAHAASRGVVVIPEFEGPGHVNAAQSALSALNCDGRVTTAYTGGEVGFSSLCLSDAVHAATAAQFLATVWAEAAKLTPGPWLHIGGDEADATLPGEYSSYVEMAGEAVAAQGKRVLGWHQIGEGELPPGGRVLGCRVPRC